MTTKYKIAERRQRIIRRTLLRRGLALVLLGCLPFGGGCHAQKPWPLWEAFAKKCIDSQGRVIDHERGDATTSEGQAYSMFFALVADDRTRFDKLLDWTEANLADGDLTAHLPAWRWGRAEDGSWKVLDANSAADADLWMAYALEQAGRLWHVERYAALGKVMAGRIAQEEVVAIPKLGVTLLPGATGFHPGPATWFLNPSYMPPSLLAYFAREDAEWSAMAASLPQLVTSPGGYTMDWLRGGADGLTAMSPPSAAASGASAPTPVGSYDAIRAYLWMGIADPRTPGVRQSLTGMRAMAAYLKNAATPPRAVDASGKVIEADGPPGFSAAVIPYLHALKLGAEENRQRLRLAATRIASPGSLNDGLYGSAGLYYDQALALFSTGWSEGRYRFDSQGELIVRWK